jgi:predicted nucleic acid-binding protein
MRIFIDTSAFFALLDKDDAFHRQATKTWKGILEGDRILVTSNYVLLECFALIQNRLGLGAVRDFQQDILPLIRIEYVDPELHRAGVSSLLAASRRNLSLVDCVSFEIMRALGIKTVLTFAPHFQEQGFSFFPK